VARTLLSAKEKNEAGRSARPTVIKHGPDTLAVARTLLSAKEKNEAGRSARPTVIKHGPDTLAVARTLLPARKRTRRAGVPAPQVVHIDRFGGGGHTEFEARSRVEKRLRRA